MAAAAEGAWVLQSLGKLLRQTDVLIELPQRQQAGVGRERSVGHLNLEGQRLEEVELEQRTR